MSKHFYGDITWTACGSNNCELLITNYKPTVTCKTCKESLWFKKCVGWIPPIEYRVYIDGRPNP